MNSIQQTQSLTYKGYAGAFASFFQTGDPNVNKLTNSSEPEVPEIRQTGKEFVIKVDGFITTDVNILNRRCMFWRQAANMVPI